MWQQRLESVQIIDSKTDIQLLSGDKQGLAEELQVKEQEQDKQTH